MKGQTASVGVLTSFVVTTAVTTALLCVGSLLMLGWVLLVQHALEQVGWQFHPDFGFILAWLLVASGWVGLLLGFGMAANVELKRQWVNLDPPDPEPR
jgi:hypothetical protein